MSEFYAVNSIEPLWGSKRRYSTEQKVEKIFADPLKLSAEARKLLVAGLCHALKFGKYPSRKSVAFTCRFTQEHVLELEKEIRLAGVDVRFPVDK